MADKEKIAKDVAIGLLAAFSAYKIYKWLGGSTKSTPAPTTDADAAAETFATFALKDLVAKLTLDLGAPGELGKIDRHKAFFLYRRLRTLGAVDPGFDSLKTQVERELNQVDAFLAKKLGTESVRGPYFGGPRGSETSEAAHLDLGKYVSQRIYDPQPTTEADAVAAAKKSEPQGRTLRELDRRRMRVIGITWRAAAIDADVWKGSGTSSMLQEPELTELLDRRLRSVERLQYEASAGATPNGIGSSFIDRQWSPANSNPRAKTNSRGEPVDEHGNTVTDPLKQAHDPEIWEDDYKVRMFERPSIPRTAALDAELTGSLTGLAWEVEGFLRDTNNLETDAGARRFNGVRWYLNHATAELDWNEWPGSRFAYTREFDPLQRNVAEGWDLISDDGSKRGYAWVVKKEHGRDRAADLIRSLFVPARDWWQRTWLHSDGVMSALHLEALQFAKLRLKDDTLFNSLPDRFALALDDYFQVRPRIASAHNGIMQPGRTLHFENASIPLDDLQIGDQVLFDTSPVLFALGATVWDYPTALVTEVDTPAESRTLDLRELKTQGFDTADLNYPSFQVLLAKTVDTALAGVREFITTELAARKAAAPPGTPPPARLNWDPGLASASDAAANDVSILRHWNPYGETWNEPGPWWIWINLSAQTWAGVFTGDVNKVLSRTPGGIVWTPDNRMLFEYRGQVDTSETIPVGAGFQPPPWDSASVQADPRHTIFVPLFQPSENWFSYLYDKAAHPDAKFGPFLDPVKSDARWLPGLATTGSGKVRAIRPRLEPRLSPQP